MRIKNWLKKLDSFKYIVDKMEFSSQMGRKLFLEREYSSNEENLNQWYECQSNFMRIRTVKANCKLVNKLRLHISEIKDITGSILVLKREGVISEVELFEIKRVSYYTNKIRCIIKELEYIDIEIESLDDIFDMLNPQNNDNLSFYLYDEYSDELNELRKRLKRTAIEDREQLYIDIEKVQITILSELSEKISLKSDLLYRVITNIAKIDYIITATDLYEKYSMTRPVIVEKETSLQQMLNPLVKDRLEIKGGVFQRIDIMFSNAPTLIYGANMSGKSVVLNSLALCQLLTQFGMFIPAKQGCIVLKDIVMLIMSDNSSLSNGLSSFGKEILEINSMIEYVENGGKPLILIDEAARTTNPVEGVAIVSALIDTFNEHEVSSMITTHYSGIKSDCRYLRVKGIRKSNIVEKISIDNINKYIDYSLEEVEGSEIPQEAITIAKMLGVNDNFIEKAKKYIN